MSAKEIQDLINGFHYWDARVSNLDCKHFADEIELSYDMGNSKIVYNFIACYKSIFDHVKNYEKVEPIKDMSIPQIPYFLQDVAIQERVEDNVRFLTCKINMFPLYLEIWCKDIIIEERSIHEDTE